MMARTWSSLITFISALGFCFIAMYCGNLYEKKLWRDKIEEIDTALYEIQSKIALEHKMGFDLAAMSFIQRDLTALEKTIALGDEGKEIFVVDYDVSSSVILYSSRRDSIGHTAPMRWRKSMEEWVQKGFKSFDAPYNQDHWVTEDTTVMILGYPLGVIRKKMIGAMILKVPKTIFSKDLMIFYEKALVCGVLILLLQYVVCFFMIKKMMRPFRQSLAHMLYVLQVGCDQKIFLPFVPQTPFEKEFDAAYHKGKTLFKLFDLINHQACADTSSSVSHGDYHDAA